MQFLQYSFEGHHHPWPGVKIVWRRPPTLQKNRDRVKKISAVLNKSLGSSKQNKNFINIFKLKCYNCHLGKHFHCGNFNGGGGFILYNLSTDPHTPLWAFMVLAKLYLGFIKVLHRMNLMTNNFEISSLLFSSRNSFQTQNSEEVRSSVESILT